MMINRAHVIGCPTLRGLGPCKCTASLEPQKPLYAKVSMHGLNSEQKIKYLERLKTMLTTIQADMGKHEPVTDVVYIDVNWEEGDGYPQ